MEQIERDRQETVLEAINMIESNLVTAEINLSAYQDCINDFFEYCNDGNSVYIKHAMSNIHGNKKNFELRIQKIINHLYMLKGAI